MARGDKVMIPFLDLKSLNTQYRAELIEACTRVIDSGWCIQKEMNVKFTKKGVNKCHQ